MERRTPVLDASSDPIDIPIKIIDRGNVSPLECCRFDDVTLGVLLVLIVTIVGVFVGVLPQLRRARRVSAIRLEAWIDVGSIDVARL